MSSKLESIQDWIRHDLTPIPIDIVVPVSGGKDSQACLKLACEQRDEGKRGNVLGLFCDTKFEHPWTYQHVERLQELYNVKIIVASTTSVEHEIKKHGQFPGAHGRHCTSNLKMAPSRRFYQALSQIQGGFESWIGIRQDESRDRSIRYHDKISRVQYPPHELFPGAYPKKLQRYGISFCLPILDWTKEDVFDYLGDNINPLYKHGFERVGCFPCLAGGDASMIKAFEFDEFGKKQYQKAKALEPYTNHSIFRKKIGQRWESKRITLKDIKRLHEGNPGCSICSM